MNLTFKKFLKLSESRRFSKKTLKRGQNVEFEHTKNPKTALKIAKDHIKEFSKINKLGEIDSDYYKELNKMERKLKK